MATRKVWRILACGIFTLAPVLNGLAQEKTGQAGKPVPVQDERTSGPHEDVKVHGHWTIVILNPDGMVASQHEFENALIATGGGQITLAQLLAHQASTPKWEIDLMFTAGNPTMRTLVTGAPANNPVLLPLTVSAPTTGTNAGKLVLAGSLPGTGPGTYAGQPVSLSGQLTRVTSGLFATCVSGVFCGGGIGSGFTDRDLTKAVAPETTPPTPITIQAGQTLNLTVVLGFQ